MKQVTPSGCGRSNSVQHALSLPVKGESGIHFTRPTETTVRRRGTIRDRLLSVEPVAVDQEPRRRLVGEVDDDRVQGVAAMAGW